MVSRLTESAQNIMIQCEDELATQYHWDCVDQSNLYFLD